MAYNDSPRTVLTDDELRDLAAKLRLIAESDALGWFTEIERREARNVAAAIESVLHFPTRRN